MTYAPLYTWPNPAFPFRIYFEHENLRIFILENIQHNFEWIKNYHSKFRKTDYFFVILGSHWNNHFVKNALDMFDFLKLKTDNFFVMYNDERDQNLFDSTGIRGSIINQNCWIDYDGTMDVQPYSDKKYDAVYVGRLIPVKRHYLAEKVNNLALVAGIIYKGNTEVTPPPHTFRNKEPLSPDQVKEIINMSKCGLILSEKEGACFASSEYLLCGVPVVSTISEGGRSAWYDDYNSLVVEPDPIRISESVSHFIENPRNPYKIRNDHIARAQHYRNVFIDEIGKLFFKHGINIDPRKYFNENYFHKMRKSYKPNFDEIF